MARGITKEPTTLNGIQFDGTDDLTVSDRIRRACLILAGIAVSLGVLGGCTGKDTPADRTSTSQPGDQSPGNRKQTEPKHEIDSKSAAKRDAEWAKTGVNLNAYNRNFGIFELTEPQMMAVKHQSREQLADMLKAAGNLNVDSNSGEDVIVKSADGTGERSYGVGIGPLDKSNGELTEVRLPSAYVEYGKSIQEGVSFTYVLKGLPVGGGEIQDILPTLTDPNSSAEIVYASVSFYDGYSIGGQAQVQDTVYTLVIGDDLDPKSISIQGSTISQMNDAPPKQVRLTSGQIPAVDTVRLVTNAPADTSAYWRPENGNGSRRPKIS